MPNGVWSPTEGSFVQVGNDGTGLAILLRLMAESKKAAAATARRKKQRQHEERF